MQFLKTLFWVILAVAVAVFAQRNWTVVTLSLWGGLRLDAKLPVLLLLAFLAGLLPTLAVYQASRWRARRRLDAAERSLAELRPAPEPPVGIEPISVAAPPPVPPVLS